MAKFRKIFGPKPQTPQQMERQIASQQERAELLEHFQKCLEVESGLTDWEVEFLEDNANRKKEQGDNVWYLNLSDKQKAIIERIYREKAS